MLDHIQEESESNCNPSHIMMKDALINKIIMKNIDALMRGSKCECQPRILVVDDNHFNIMVIKSLIKEDFGIEVE